VKERNDEYTFDVTSHCRPPEHGLASLALAAKTVIALGYRV
jgi:hypothetical protein